MTFEIVFVLLALLGMVAALVADKMRPGMILFSVVVLFLCAGILTPKEMLEGFSNKGMITVALLFLVSEGIRQSGTLGQVIKKLLPQGKTTVFKAQQALGQCGEASCYKILDTSFLCHYSGWYLYADRYLY